MALTELQIRNASPAAKPFKLADSSGLFVLVRPNGSKLFRLRYSLNGKRRDLSLGAYPKVSLKEARLRADDARIKVRQGHDPAEVKKAEKRKRAAQAANTFEAIAREFVANRASRRAVEYQGYTLRRLQNDIFPELGSRSIDEITAPELLAVLRKIEARGASEMAHRVRVICGQVFRYAIATGRAERDVAADLKGALVPHKSTPHPAVSEAKLPALLNDIAKYRGDPVTRAALELLVLTFVRVEELVGATWDEIDLDGRLWTIAGHRMKVKNDQGHLVPLASQTIPIFEEMRSINGDRRFVFAMDNRSGYLSTQAPLYALHRMGWKGRMTVHGFRAVASTILNEERERGNHEFSPDVIERQLDHVERNNSRRPYNRSEYIRTRTAMMQWWGDYLDARGKALAACCRGECLPDD